MLEIGVGNRTVSNYLKENGVDITTFDFDKELKPDIVGDVRDMKGIKDNSFDVVDLWAVRRFKNNDIASRWLMM